MDSEKLIFSLLGPPLITFRGKEIQVRRRKVRYLCYYLACQKFPVSRANLCDMFWPECNELEARKNLREALSNLRSSLSMGDYLLIHGDFISLNSEKIEVDVREFEDVVELMRKNLDITSGASFIDPVYLKVRNGVQLWRTLGFLSGASLEGSAAFQKWAIEKNQDMEYWRQLMLEWLADHCITLGNLNEALQWLSLALLNDKQNTELNLLLLNCLKDLAAWSELSHFCEMLESIYQENGESNMPFLLRDSIARAREAAASPMQNLPSVWKDTDPYRIHFIDSKQRLAQLKKRFHRGGMVLLRGETGSGKSRLLREFYNSLEVIPRLIYHSAKPGDESIPYQALVEGFKSTVSDEEWRALEPIYAKALFPLFPYIKKVRGDIKADDLEFAVGLKRLLPEAFLALFTLLAHQRRCLYVLDDAQWCDAETLNALTYVHERGGPDEIGTAILAAQVEVKNLALEKIILHYANDNFVDLVEVSVLSDDEISEIVYLIFGEKPSNACCTWLAGESGRNPELLIDLLNALKEDGIQIRTYAGNEPYALNQALRQNVLCRLSEFSAAEQDLLAAAAVIGREFSPALFEGLSGEEPQRLEALLISFVDKRLLQVKLGDVTGDCYEFVHGVVQRTLLEQMDPAKKRLLHLKTIKVLKSLAGDNLETSFTIAGHYDAIHDARHAFEYWLHAGDQARKAYLPDFVGLAFGRALELCEILGEKCSNQDYYHLVRVWSDYVIDLGDLKTSEMIYSKSMQEGKRRNDQRLIGFAECGQALLESMPGHFEVSMEFINRAIERLSKVGSLENYARAYALRGVIETLHGEFSQAIEDFLLVNKMTMQEEDVALDDLRLFCAGYLVGAFCGVGRLQEAREYVSTVTLAAQISNHRSYLAITKASAALIHYACGDYAGALERIHALDQVKQGFGIRWWKDILKLIEASVYLEMGDLSLCWNILTQLQAAIGDNEKYLFLNAYAIYIKGELYRRLNDNATARQYYERCLHGTENEYIKTLALMGLSICQYFYIGGTNGEELLASVLERAKNFNYQFLETDIRALDLLLYGNLMAGSAFTNEVSWLEGQIQLSGQTTLLPELYLLQGTGANLLNNGYFDYEKYKQGAAEAEKQGSFWLELYCLARIIVHSPAGAIITSERRKYRQLLDKLSLTTANETLDPGVKKFVGEQERILKR